jgi:purine nucleoside permease
MIKLSSATCKNYKIIRYVSDSEPILVKGAENSVYCYKDGVCGTVHGPGLSNEAQYIAQLYEADDYVITEMEATAIAQVLDRTVCTKRLMSVRGAVNFDQGHPKESTLDHLDPAPGETAGGFEETVENIMLVDSKMTDHIVTKTACIIKVQKAFFLVQNRDLTDVLHQKMASINIFKLSFDIVFLCM